MQLFWFMSVSLRSIFVNNEKWNGRRMHPVVATMCNSKNDSSRCNRQHVHHVCAPIIDRCIPSERTKTEQSNWRQNYSIDSNPFNSFTNRMKEKKPPPKSFGFRKNKTEQSVNSIDFRTQPQNKSKRKVLFYASVYQPQIQLLLRSFRLCPFIVARNFIDFFNIFSGLFLMYLSAKNV